MAAPTLQAQGTLAAVTTGNLAITLPTYAANDIVVITTVGYVPNTTTGANTQSLASPWTKNSPDLTVITGGLIDEEHACWWARATSASSLGTTVTITRPANWDTGNDTCWAGRAYVIRGCPTTGDPFDEFGQTALSTAANPALPAITVNGGNRLAIVFMTKADNATLPTAATGYTVGTVETTATGTDAGMNSYRQTASANVATVTPTGGIAPAQGNSAYFSFSFTPEPVTATASAALGGSTPTATATVTHLATATAALGALTASATAQTTNIIYATLAAPLGGLTSSASATVTHLASADAPLGALSASATATVVPTVLAVADAPLGGLAASASATVTHVASAAAALGGLTASASASVTKFAVLDAPLGGLVSSASATITHTASGSAALGGLTASATAQIAGDVVAVAALGALAASGSATVTRFAVGSAALGGLTATAIGPGAPPSPGGDHARPNPYLRPRQRKPVKSKGRGPKVQVVEKPAPKTVSGRGRANVARMNAKAEAKITFSGEEDDLQVLLML